MHPHNYQGRFMRPGPVLPTFRNTPSSAPSSEDRAHADAVIRGLGAAPPPKPCRRYYAQTPDGRQVTTRSNQPIEAVIDALEQRAQSSVSAVVEEGSRASSTPRHAVSMPHPLEVSQGQKSPHTGISLVPQRESNRHWLEATMSGAQIVVDDLSMQHHPGHRYMPTSARISDRAPTFLRYVKQKNSSRPTVLDTIFTLRIFIEMVGDKPLCEIGLEDTDRFIQALSAWPPHASKRREFRLLRAPEVIAKARILGTPRLNLRTQQKHIDRLRTFFRWLELRHEVRPDLLRGVRLYRTGQDFAMNRQPFSEDELRLIFDVHSKAAFETPFMFWAPLLGLYAGMRINEIGQLYVDDVQPVQGTWCLNLTRDRPGQRLKNRQSRRCIPIHSVLLNGGFLAFVEQARRWNRSTLFPGVVWGDNGPGDTIGDWFNRTFLRKRCGITASTRTFHSFRHCFATYGDRSRVPDSRLANLLGHNSGPSILRTHYVQLATSNDLAADLAAIKFPTIEHAIYVPESYENAFAKADADESRQARLSAVYDTR
jgi:integrase